MANFTKRDQMREIIKTLLLTGATPVEKPDDQGYDVPMYLETIFGYIAIVGTSKKAEHYGEVDIIGPRSTRDALDARGKVDINLCVRKMLSLSATVRGGPAAKATLRQMCEPFAHEAYVFLTRGASLGIFTQLAVKMARLGNKEPQVMFDFNSGLDLTSLTLQEATVIQGLNSRLFRTEGAKTVFNAQASVGEQAAEV
ncbi:coat protein [Grapevine virus M]|nr:coat protein [Grapevine virus M]